MKSLGYNEGELDLLKLYIADEAPVIIHVNFKKYMPYFLLDTNYRNLFETNKTSGSSDKNFRMTKENKMFKNVYYYAQSY